MTSNADRFTIRHDGVSLPVSRGGAGRPLVRCPCLTSTQAELQELVALLRRDFEVLTFDLRGHGRSSAADRYCFDAFLGDLTGVLAEVARLGLPAPVLVGHSYGADLIVHYAAENAATVGELVLIDGANPIPEPFLTAAEIPEFRAMWEDSATWRASFAGTPRQVLLTPREILDLNLELEGIRSTILDRYRRIDRPIHMIMATSMAGDDGEPRARQRNRLWRSGIERLKGERPDIAVSWMDATHALVVTHAPQVAERIRIGASARRPDRC